MSARFALASRYTAVAITCLLVHNIVIVASDLAGLWMPLAVLISFCVCVLLGFLLHARVTFTVRPGLAALGRYAAAMLANIPLTIIFLHILNVELDWPMTLASPVASVLLVAANFALSRWALVGWAWK